MTEEFSDKGDTNITQKYSGSSLQDRADVGTRFIFGNGSGKPKTQKPDGSS